MHGARSPWTHIIASVCALGLSVGLSGCFLEKSTDDDSSSSKSCASLSGSAWVPSVTGASSAKHDSGVEVYTDIYTDTHELAGLGQGLRCSATNGTTCPDTRDRLMTFNIDMTEDLGANGSLSITAETTSIDGDLVGSAYPVLVSLTDGSGGHELLKMPIAAGQSCATTGIFSCSGGDCSPNLGCSPGAQSIYKDWTHWRQFNIPSFGEASNNLFPLCNWGSGSPACNYASGGNYFDSGHLKYGTTYVAKYALIATNYSKLSGYAGSIKLTVTRKKDTTAATLPPTAGNNGAVDINVILVGDENVRASRTEKGKANLNALLQHVQDLYSATGTGPGVSLGTITSYEWDCNHGGESYSVVEFEELAELFAAGSNRVAAASEGKAINVFLVSEINYSALNASILGVAGSIGGPMVNGTGSSGVVFKSFDKIDTFNPECSGSTCPESQQEAQFIDWGATVTHEMGHYLGLNHPNERDASNQDPVPDTPTCSANGQATVTIPSCIASAACSTPCNAATTSTYNGTTRFCPAVQECQFNHVMWYTTKNYNITLDAGDGNMFSPQASTVVNYNPFVY